MKNPFYNSIPTCAWSRSIGKGWDKPYTVRKDSNVDDGPWHGMPLGGFGAGCIGRSSRGDFNFWHIDGGEHTFQNISACQFSVFESSNNHNIAHALSTEVNSNAALSAWKCYPATSEESSTGTYHALYPRSWFVYENVFQAQLSCEQFSPVWAENYQETSYPVAIFVWNASNPTDVPITLSIMLTWQNMVGWFTNTVKSPEVEMRDDGSPVYDYQPNLNQSKNNFNQLVTNSEYIGCVLDKVGTAEPVEGEGSWCIATAKHPKVEIFHHNRWNPSGAGEDIW
ncbi:MAG: GH116 family glycosyl-hydrolase, partial [Cyanobacteria bacterium J06573_2]